MPGEASWGRGIPPGCSFMSDILWSGVRGGGIVFLENTPVLKLTHTSLASSSLYGTYVNSADSDQTPHNMASDRGLDCLLMNILLINKLSLNGLILFSAISAIVSINNNGFIQTPANLDLHRFQTSISRTSIICYQSEKGVLSFNFDQSGNNSMKRINGNCRSRRYSSAI